MSAPVPPTTTLPPPPPPVPAPREKVDEEDLTTGSGLAKTCCEEATDVEEPRTAIEVGGDPMTTLLSLLLSLPPLSWLVGGESS